MPRTSADLSMLIGSRLRAARKALGLSLTDLAARTGGALTKSRISNYEQGLRRMGVEEARMLATALGTVSAAYLLCLEDSGFLVEEEQRLLERYRRTDERGRATIQAVAAAEAERTGEHQP
jgi:transcriptional regulator with XRE-family HTH domain